MSKLNTDDSNVALQGYSPVSYIDDGEARRGHPDHKVEHKGATYYFTTEEEVVKFRSNPERYEPAFGGWCAFGMTVDQRFRVDPESFKIVDGKLCLFLNDLETNARDLWNQGDATELLDKAAANWERFRSSQAA